MKAARQHGAIAIPAHPGRFGIGLTEYIQQGEVFEDVHIVERLNGGSRQGENERAWELCDSHGYIGIGGSDAHLTSHIATCLTHFPQTITSERDPCGCAAVREVPPDLAGTDQGRRRQIGGFCPGAGPSHSHEHHRLRSEGIDTW